MRRARFLVFLAAASCGAAGASPPRSSTPPPVRVFAAAAGAASPFAKCLACHNAEQGGADGIGPNLFGVFGRRAGSRKSYAYSDAIRRSRLRWDSATLDRFLIAPREAVPGTKMTFPGLRKPEEREAVIAFLKRRS
jgi:cytochrome c